MSDLNERVSQFLRLAQENELHNLEQLARLGRCVIAISNVLHELQYERGLSNMVLGSQGVRCRSELTEQWQRVDALYPLFEQALDDIYQNQHALRGHNRLFQRLAYALHSLEQLAELRQQIWHGKLSPITAMTAYSELVQSLLAVVFESANIANDEHITRILVSMFNLMQGKELAGQERAAGAAGFADNDFDPRLRERLSALIDQQERCFAIFTDYADDATLTHWQSMLRADFQLDFERLRRLALTATRPSMTGEYDLTWFLVCSQRMNAIKAVEEQLETELLQQCQQRILSARSASEQHDTLLNELQRSGFDAIPSFAVVMNDIEDHSDDDEHHHASGRSIKALVEAQAKRLRKLHDELHEARGELHERKVIERAKRELMLHRQLSEPDAYSLLRKMAMNQNKRLVDVANTVLSMTELL